MGEKGLGQERVFLYLDGCFRSIAKSLMTLCKKKIKKKKKREFAPVDSSLWLNLLLELFSNLYLTLYYFHSEVLI